MIENLNLRYTEDILNNTNWINKDGEILDPISMDEGHIQSTLRLLYRNRDQLWLGCRDFTLIDVYLNGEDFFQKVIRKSTLWKSLIKALNKPSTSFNFDYEGGSID